MGAAIALRGDFDSRSLRQLANATKDAEQSRRFSRGRRFMTAVRARMRHG